MINAIFQQYIQEKAGQTIQIKTWDSVDNVYRFEEISVDAINNMGKIKVIGSTTYLDRTQIAQALQMLGQNPLFMDEVVRNNFSPTVLGQVFSFVTGLDRFPDLFKKDERLYEITDQQKLVEELSQQVDRTKAEGLAEAQGLPQQLMMERNLGDPNAAV